MPLAPTHLPFVPLTGPLWFESLTMSGSTALPRTIGLLFVLSLPDGSQGGRSPPLRAGGRPEGPAGARSSAGRVPLAPTHLPFVPLTGPLWFESLTMSGTTVHPHHERLCPLVIPRSS